MSPVGQWRGFDVALCRIIGINRRVGTSHWEGAEPPQSTPKESKWLSRFLRSSKSNGTERLPRVDGMESTSSTVLLRSNDPKMLNPSFFSHDDVAGAL